jgi:hypothetical protein
MSTSNESVRVTSQILLVSVLVMSHRRRCMSHSLCVIGVDDEVRMTVPMIVRYVHSNKKEKRNMYGHNLSFNLYMLYIFLSNLSITKLCRHLKRITTLEALGK